MQIIVNHKAHQCGTQAICTFQALLYRKCLYSVFFQSGQFHSLIDVDLKKKRKLFIENKNYFFARFTRVSS